MSLSAVFVWFLERTRPELHYATMVVVCSFAFCVMTFVPLVLVSALFGVELRIRYELLAHLVGNTGVGALVAGYLRHHLPSGPSRRWVVAASFGGVACAIFGALVNLKHGDSILVGLLVGAFSGAAFGALILWSVSRESGKVTGGSA